MILSVTKTTSGIDTVCLADPGFTVCSLNNLFFLGGEGKGGKRMKTSSFYLQLIASFLYLLYHPIQGAKYNYTVPA